VKRNNSPSPQQDDEEWIGYAERCYRTGQRLAENANVWGTNIQSDDPKLIGILLLIRTLSNFRGAQILARRRMVVETRILTRCCFENLFTIFALKERGQKFVAEMKKEHDASRKARGEFLLKHARAEDHELQLVLRSLKSKRRSLNPTNVAATGSIEQGYAYYAQLSADAGHPGIEALERYKTWVDSALHVQTVIDEGEIRETVILACEALIGVCVAASALLDAPDDPELIRLIEETRRLSEKSLAKSHRV
jgi:hypothetical protein